MGFRILQCNLNKSRRAQDVLGQFILEQTTDVCAVSEPWRILNGWFGSEDGLAAICCNRNALSGSCRLFRKGTRFVAVRCDLFVLVSCYVAPSASYESFKEFLSELDRLLDALGDFPVIICGDFNAYAAFWCSPTTDRTGSLLLRWTAGYDLRLVNDGVSPTCIRVQGESIIDLTWVSPRLVHSVSD